MPRKSSLESFHNRVSPPPIPVNKSEDKYRSFIENLPVLFYAVHPAPPYSPIYVSPAFEKFGYPLDLWTTDTEIWLRVIHQDDLNWVFEKAAASTLSGDDFDHEYRIVDARGDTHWVRDISRMIRDENRREGVILDIPDRRLDRETGIVSEERYRSLFENANDIIYVHDLEGNYLSVNRAAVRVFGYTREEALN